MISPPSPRAPRREKRTFTWDWHAWNLALVSTPSFLLAYYLHGVEKRMHEEAAIRDEIQERTGVSSRGFLIPKKEVREEVLGLLSAGNQRGAEAATSGGDGEGEVNYVNRNTCPVPDNRVLTGVKVVGDRCKLVSVSSCKRYRRSCKARPRVLSDLSCARCTRRECRASM